MKRRSLQKRPEGFTLLEIMVVVIIIGVLAATIIPQFMGTTHDAKVSARNIFCGTISKIIEGPVNTEVDLDIGSGNTISAVITHESAGQLGLAVGGHACTLFKASSVILGVS